MDRRNFILNTLGFTFTSSLLPTQSLAKSIIVEEPIRKELYETAWAWEGYSEKNPQQRQELIKYFKEQLGYALDPVKTPWCAGWVDAILNEIGLPKQNSLWARDFLNYNTEADNPKFGDIAVFSRSKGYGHVGFLLGFTETKDVAIISGNASGKVKKSVYSKSRLLGIRSLV